MPIEVRELVIRARVGPQPESSSGQDGAYNHGATGRAGNRNEAQASCALTDQVVAILKQQKER